MEKTLILRNANHMTCYKLDKVMCFECYKDDEGYYTSINIYTLDNQVFRITKQVKETAQLLYEFWTQGKIDNLIVDFNFVSLVVSKLL